jgi:tRNA(Glu) U13 pseudouridine synthase TruD
MNSILPEGSLKETPDSFIVQEIVNSNQPYAVEFCDYSLIHGWDGNFSHTIFSLSKRGCSAEEAMDEVAHQLGVHFDDISVHGLKDKHAKTSQHIGVRGDFRPDFSHPDMNLVQLYGQNYPLAQGDIVGNRFKIFIVSTADKINEEAVKVVPNFFGKQRLGREGSEQVGRFFLEGKTGEALEILFQNREAVRKLKRAKKKAGGGSWEEALSHPSYAFSRKFEVQKWQSYLWNKLRQEKQDQLGEGIPFNLPMWNHKHKDIFEMYKHLWDPSLLDYKLLDLPIFQRLFGRRRYRPTTVSPVDFKAERKTLGWDVTLGWECKFDLPPGSYGTVVLDQVFDLKEPDRRNRRGLH